MENPLVIIVLRISTKIEIRKYMAILKTVNTTGLSTITLVYKEQNNDAKIIQTPSKKMVQPITIWLMDMKDTRLSLIGKYKNNANTSAKKKYSAKRYVCTLDENSRTLRNSNIPKC